MEIGVTTYAQRAVLIIHAMWLMEDASVAKTTLESSAKKHVHTIAWIVIHLTVVHDVPKVGLANCVKITVALPVSTTAARTTDVVSAFRDMQMRHIATPLLHMNPTTVHKPL